VFVQILNVLAEDLYARGQIDLAECFIDGTFVPAKKGHRCRERGKGSKIMAIPGLPIAIHVSSASPHESQLVEPTLILWRMNPNA
jgi:hypothetical protein